MFHKSRINSSKLAKIILQHTLFFVGRQKNKMEPESKKMACFSLLVLCFANCEEVRLQECLSHSSFHWREDWTANASLVWKVMSTVQSSSGVLEPSGFAARCSWVVGCRHGVQRYANMTFIFMTYRFACLTGHWGVINKFTAWGSLDRLPTTIFVQAELVATFYRRILPCLPSSARFVLLTGDHDGTTPNQLDVRYKKDLTPAEWRSMLDDRRIVHMFIEHLDDATALRARVTSLPLGLNPLEFASNNPDDVLSAVAWPTPGTLQQRPLRALQCDRVYTSADQIMQFEERKRVAALCLSSSWSSLCDSRANIPIGSFFTTIQEYPFLLCVHGGGLEPSPKAWTALLAGVIPVR